MSEMHSMATNDSSKWSVAYKERQQASLELPFFYWKMEDRPRDIYGHLEMLEKKLICPSGSSQDYAIGTATLPDEIGLFEGNGTWIVTTEHATPQQRLYIGEISRRRKDQEYGIAAIGQYLHEQLGVTHITMVGRQTADANNDSSHPFKEALKRQILFSGLDLRGTISLHGMTDIKTDDIFAERPYDVAIGIGDAPSSATLQFVKVFLSVAEDLGLKTGVNIPFVVFDANGPVNNSGVVKKVAFNAVGNTTRAFAELQMQHYGEQAPAAVQIELSSALRWMPPEEEKRFGEKKSIGVALGYAVLRQTLRKLEEKSSTSSS